jgi:cell wall-associated NlpC family hydrolase
MLLILAGCSGKVTYQQSTVSQPRMDVDLSDRNETVRLLDQHFKKWSGAPYRKGGRDKRGIDCSGFVQQTYSTLFGISLPRTTRIQAQTGDKISRPELRPTDLVFFKTGLFNKHVGIYKGNGQFMHVSTKRGVSLSSLSDEYWEDHFWQARRIIE